MCFNPEANSCLVEDILLLLCGNIRQHLLAVLVIVYHKAILVSVYVINAHWSVGRLDVFSTLPLHSVSHEKRGVLILILATEPEDVDGVGISIHCLHAFYLLLGVW